jgi:hypothetical protein
MGKRHWFLRVSRTKIIGIAFKKLVAFFPATFRGAITLKHEYYNRRKAVWAVRESGQTGYFKLLNTTVICPQYINLRRNAQSVVCCAAQFNTGGSINDLC